MALMKTSNPALGKNTFSDFQGSQYGGSLITNITDPLNFTIRQDWCPTNAVAPGFPRSLQRTIDKRGLVSNYQYDNRGNVTNLLVYATNTVTGLVADLTGDDAEKLIAGIKQHQQTGGSGGDYYKGASDANQLNNDYMLINKLTLTF